MLTALQRVRAQLEDGLFLARLSFKSKRAEFYGDLADSMENEPQTRITKFIERYADRYPEQAVGKLAAHWLRAYRVHGSFAEAIRGTVPDEDIAALAIAESAGDLKVGLHNLAASVAGLDATRGAMMTVFGSTFLVAVAVHFYVGLYAWQIIPKIESALPSTVRVENLGYAAIFLHGMRIAVQHYWMLWFAAMLALTGLVIWAIPNYVGRFRPWLDRKVLFFQLYREFQAASFLTSLAAVTQRINNKVLPVPQALKMMERDATVWLRWHIGAVLLQIEENPQGKGENFNTGVVSQDMLYRMIDIAEYADMSDMLDKVGRQVLKRAPIEMEKRAKRIQFVTRVAMVSIVLGLMWGFNAMTYSFQDALTIDAFMR